MTTLPIPEDRQPPRDRFHVSVIFLVLFAIVLASLPARNSDILSSLANGRDLAQGTVRFSTGWPLDLAAYVAHSILGGWSLAIAKAVALGFVAFILSRDRTRSGWMAPSIVVGCAVLAMNHRIPLGPPVVSVLLFAIILWRNRRIAETPVPRRRIDWPHVVLIAVWANVHDWWLFGVLTLVAIELGRWLDRGRTGAPLGWPGFAVMIGAGFLSPYAFEGVRLPAVLRWLGDASGDGGLESFGARIHSPFSDAYRAIFAETPAALAFHLLLSIAGLSFVASIRNGSWSRFLPFLILAAISGIESRTVPLFAVLAPFVILGNLETLSRTDAPRPTRLFGCIGILFGSAFLVAAWPGWLQSRPYEPRSWSVLPPPDLAAGATAFRSIKFERPHGARTLHLVRETSAAFRWHCPDDRGIVDDRAIDALLAPPESLDAADALLDELGIDRIVVRGGDPICDAHLARLAARTDRWRLIAAGGGVATFARRDALPPTATELDWDRIAYRPTDFEQAPSGQPAAIEGHPVRRWLLADPSTVSPARDDARLQLKLVESLGASAPLDHLRTWDAMQLAGLIGGANGLIGSSPTETALRGNLFRPVLPDADPFAKGGPPPLARLVFAMQQRFAIERGQATPGRVYSAIRAARRATAEAPDDALAHLVLARAYQSLPQYTMEQRWAARLPRIARLRNVQASAAYNRAVRLNPDLAEAHYELGQLYRGAGCFDLALQHLREWRTLERIRLRVGGDRARLDQLEPVIERMGTEVAKQLAEFEKETSRISVGDRAASAVRRGLGGTARDLLLKSDVSAFGKTGTEIEIDFLLRTGRPRDVLDWLDPEVQGTLGAFAYRWSRAQAQAALGHYSAAREELAASLGETGQVPTPASVRRRIGELLGFALLDEQPNRDPLPQWLLYALRHSDFVNHMLDLEATLTRECEVAILDGLLSLESGRMADARARFESVLALAPRRGASGQLNAPVIEVAREALDLLNRFGEPGRPGP
jgi:TPR repeat